VPLTVEQHEKNLQEPALCEQLAVRDYLDDVVVRTSGSFVAGYALKGLTSYFASDEGRKRSRGIANMASSKAASVTSAMRTCPSTISRRALAGSNMRCIHPH